MDGWDACYRVIISLGTTGVLDRCHVVPTLLGWRPPTRIAYCIIFQHNSLFYCRCYPARGKWFNWLKQERKEDHLLVKTTSITYFNSSTHMSISPFWHFTISIVHRDHFITPLSNLELQCLLHTKILK